MWIFGSKSQLLRSLDSLATYNDKGIAWSKHKQEKVTAERAMRMAKIKFLVAKIGRSKFPAEFLVASESGALSTDGTGCYVAMVKSHLRRGNTAL